MIRLWHIKSMIRNRLRHGDNFTLSFLENGISHYDMSSIFMDDLIMRLRAIKKGNMILSPAKLHHII